MQSEAGILLQHSLNELSNIQGVKSYSKDNQLKPNTLEFELSQLETSNNNLNESLGEILCKLAEIKSVDKNYLSAGRCGSILSLNYFLSRESLKKEEMNNFYFRKVLKNINLNVRNRCKCIAFSNNLLVY